MQPLVTTSRSTQMVSVRLIYPSILLFISIFCSNMHAATANDHMVELRQIAQLVEYVGVDYSSAVKDGRVIDTGEYREMVEFSVIIIEKASRITQSSGSAQTITNQAHSLLAAIKTKQSADAVQRLTAQLRSEVLALAPQLSLPDALLPSTDSRELYRKTCAACHGSRGEGNGVIAATMEPAPTDFTDEERALKRSILGLYDAIANGIDGTAMPAFPQLTERQKWSLAFYAGGLAFQPFRQAQSDISSVISLQQLVSYSPSVLASGLSENQRVAIKQLRANPESLFVREISPLAVTRERLEEARAAYHRGDYGNAHTLAVSAYLDGFELVENSLDARNQTLRKNIEATLISLRQAITRPQKDAELKIIMSSAFQKLDQAERLLSGSSLSNSALFSASLIILLREGLEALLVIIALMTVLIRTGRHDAVKYIHIGWIAALFAGGATWAAAQSLINISGASREMMEGVAAMLAALVLFYVGVWMHSKTHAAHWQSYIQQHINSRLQSGTLWGLTALAFIAVYREVFETVLFYQSLLTQTSVTQYSHVAGGFLAGAAILGTLAWVVIKYSIKLPVARFFAATTYLLLALSFILMGKAVSALQEAAVLDISPLPVTFSIEWIGVNSTWQGILAQALILLGFAVFVLRSQICRRPPQGEALDTKVEH